QFVAALVTAASVQEWLHQGLGTSPITIGKGWDGVLLQFLVLYLTRDFADYFIHYLQHKVALLWRLHRVHHSAEILTPFTGLARRHPGDFAVEFLGKGYLGGVLAGAVMFLFGMKVDARSAVILTLVGLPQGLLLPF